MVFSFILVFNDSAVSYCCRSWLRCLFVFLLKIEYSQSQKASPKRATSWFSSEKVLSQAEELGLKLKKGTMSISQSRPHERLRSMVGINGWDYCVFWKLGEDQRCLEWTGCCCCGAAIIESGAEQLSGVSPSCRDVLFPHRRTKTCDILTELPISMQLDSGIHAQVFLSSEPRWINFSDLTASEESSKTRVLIPSMCGGGLVELFISKHVSEDPQLMQFVSAHHNFNFSPTEQEFTASPSMNEGIVREASTNFENSNFHQQENLLSSSSPPFLPKNNNLNLFHPWTSEPENIPWDMSVNQIQHSNSPLIFLGQQFPPSNKHDIFLKDSTDPAIYDKPSLNTIEYGGKLSKELPNDKGSIKQEMGRAESVSDCSDQQEDEDDHKVVGRSGRKHQSKNLFAERKRRKKLKERLYALRALVPKITKMDRASILGDAIEYVKELQKQVKQFQDELEENLDEEGDKQVPTLLTQNGVYQKNDNNDDQGTRCSSTTKTSGLLKQNNEAISIDDKSQQMEVQVEVNQGDGNEFNLKIFCQEKAGGFVRLMLAMDVLGLEVIHVNITNFRGFVLNVFKAEIRDNETIQPELVRDSLLELTQNPNGWTHAVRDGKNGSPDYHNNNHRHLHHLNHH